MGLSPPQPEAPDPNQVIVAHGDIDSSGSCHIKVFEAGENVVNLGRGTYRLVRLTGNADQINQAITSIQAGAASDAGMTCPRL